MDFDHCSFQPDQNNKNTGHTRLTQAHQNGGNFSLNRFDYANRWQTSTSGTLTIPGLRQDGNQIIDTITFPIIYWYKRTLNWTDLIQVDFISTDGRVMLDKIEVSTP